MAKFSEPMTRVDGSIGWIALSITGKQKCVPQNEIQRFISVSAYRLSME